MPLRRPPSPWRRSSSRWPAHDGLAGRPVASPCPPFAPPLPKSPAPFPPLLVLASRDNFTSIAAIHRPPAPASIPIRMLLPGTANAFPGSLGAQGPAEGRSAENCGPRVVPRRLKRPVRPSKAASPRRVRPRSVAQPMRLFAPSFQENLIAPSQPAAAGRLLAVNRLCRVQATDRKE